jgi:hypothetical protein
VDVFEFVQHLRVTDDILVAGVIIAMFSYMAYPQVERVTSRVLVRAGSGLNIIAAKDRQ